MRLLLFSALFASAAAQELTIEPDGIVVINPGGIIDLRGGPLAGPPASGDDGGGAVQASPLPSPSPTPPPSPTVPSPTPPPPSPPPPESPSACYLSPGANNDDTTTACTRDGHTVRCANWHSSGNGRCSCPILVHNGLDYRISSNPGSYRTNAHRMWCYLATGLSNAVTHSANGNWGSTYSVDRRAQFWASGDNTLAVGGLSGAYSVFDTTDRWNDYIGCTWQGASSSG